MVTFSPIPFWFSSSPILLCFASLGSTLCCIWIFLSLNFYLTSQLHHTKLSSRPAPRLIPFLASRDFCSTFFSSHFSLVLYLLGLLCIGMSQGSELSFVYFFVSHFTVCTNHSIISTSGPKPQILLFNIAQIQPLSFFCNSEMGLTIQLLKSIVLELNFILFCPLIPHIQSPQPCSKAGLKAIHSKAVQHIG